VKKVFLQKHMLLPIVLGLYLALLDMPHSIEACILNFRGEVLLHSTALYVGHKHAGSVHATDILLESLRHKLYTVSG